LKPSWPDLTLPPINLYSASAMNYEQDNIVPAASKRHLEAIKRHCEGMIKSVESVYANRLQDRYAQAYINANKGVLELIKMLEEQNKFVGEQNK